MDLRALPTELWLALVALVVLWGLLQSARLAWHKGKKQRAMARARERGAAGEARAEDLLERLGFRILGRQVVRRYGVGVDGDVVEVDLRADYLVGRDGQRYVAEVKTGRLAPRIATPATRRQLLEYRMAFDVDGVLLVDAESDRVSRIVFPLPVTTEGSARWSSKLGWLLFGLATGATIAWAVKAG